MHKYLIVQINDSIKIALKALFRTPHGGDVVSCAAVFFGVGGRHATERGRYVKYEKPAAKKNMGGAVYSSVKTMP